jgi:hypothetical protein
MLNGRHRFQFFHACQLAILMLLSSVVPAVAQTPSQFPGGWIENQGTATRARYTASQIQSFVPPTRGAFMFPAPYNTKAIRITDASDCGGADCVAYVGYSYWRNTNAHEGSNDMLMFLGLNTAQGGSGMTLFRLNKTTDAITKVGPLFPTGNKFNSWSGNSWYFSGSRPTKLYLSDGPRMLRYDVISKTFETVYDVTAQFGSNRNIFQMHSSNDDRVHSATLQVTNTGEYLGCMVYNETTRQFSFFAKQGTFDECHIDKSGRYLMILENIDGLNDTENVFIDLQTGVQRTVYDQNGGLGHADMGFGYALGADNWNPLPNAIISYDFSPTFVTKGPAMFRSTAFGMAQIGHLSHQNARASLPMNQQFACGSNANRTSIQNEVLCFRLDTSQDQLVVAPVMTNLDAFGGGSEYAKAPKGNLDISGKYYIWTTNLGGGRLDAFLVKVPSHLLISPGDITSPEAPKNLRLG